MRGSEDTPAQIPACHALPCTRLQQSDFLWCEKMFTPTLLCGIMWYQQSQTWAVQKTNKNPKFVGYRGTSRKLGDCMHAHQTP